MPVSVKRLLPQSGNAIFHKGWPCVWYNKLQTEFEALEKCLSARNASCRRAAAPFFTKVGLACGIIASNI